MALRSAGTGLDGERLADLKNAGHDADRNEGNEEEGRHEGSGGDEGGEAFEALGQLLTESFGDFRHTLGEVSGVFAHCEDIEGEVGHEGVAAEGLRNGEAFIDLLTGDVKACAEGAVVDGTLGELQGFSGIDAALKKGADEVAELEEIPVEGDFSEERDAEEPGIGAGAAGFSLAPLAEGEGGYRKPDLDKGAELHEEVGAADEEFRAPGHFRAEAFEHALNLRQEDGQEKDDNAHRDRANEGGVKHTREHLAADRLLFFEVIDDLGEDRHEVTGVFPRLDDVGAGTVEIVGLAGESAREGTAFAEVAPEFLGECFEFRLAEALAENLDGITGG